MSLKMYIRVKKKKIERVEGSGVVRLYKEVRADVLALGWVWCLEN